MPVVVWKLDDKNDLRNLDRYEGYPSYYVKKRINVIMENGEKLKAMVYTMAKDRKGIFPPSQVYLDCIREGYEANKIDITPLYEAVHESICIDNITKYNQYNPRKYEIDNPYNYNWDYTDWM